MLRKLFPGLTFAPSFDFPAWTIPVATHPMLAQDQVTEVPYLHPMLGVARPGRWPHSRNAWRAFALLGLMPVLLLGIGALSLLHFRWPLRTSGVSGWLQQTVFHTVTMFQDEGCVDPVQVGVMFPGEVAAWPVDVGVLEPVVVLNALRCKTTGCCAGHPGGLTPYVELAENHTFPLDLLQALKDAGVPYELRAPHWESGPTLLAGTEPTWPAFLAVLQAWATAKAPEVLAPLDSSEDPADAEAPVEEQNQTA